MRAVLAGLLLAALALRGDAAGADRATAPASLVIEAQPMRVGRDHLVNVAPVAPFYSPDVVRAQVGDSVVWRNGKMADTTHSVRDTSHGSFSLDIPPGGEARFATKEPGEYVYRCRFHPWMIGRLIVEPRRLKVAWQDLPRGFQAARLLAGANGKVLLMEQGDRPRVLRATADGFATIGKPAQAIRGDATAVSTADDSLLWLARDASRLERLAADGTTATLDLPEGASPAGTVAVAADSRLWLRGRQPGEWLGVDARPGIGIVRVQADGEVLAAGPRDWWLRDADGHLNHLDPDSGKLSAGAALGQTTLRLLANDSRGAWLAGDDATLTQVGSDGQAKAFALAAPGDLIVALASDRRALLWAMLRSGSLVRIDAGQPQSFELSEPPVQAAGMIVDAAGTVWLLDGARRRLGSIKPG